MQDRGTLLVMVIKEAKGEYLLRGGMKDGE